MIRATMIAIKQAAKALRDFDDQLKEAQAAFGSLKDARLAMDSVKQNRPWPPWAGGGKS